MSEFISHTEIKIGSERNFGLVFSFVFFIIGIYPLFNKGEVNYLAFLVSIILCLIALIRPNILTLPNRLWFKFGLLLGMITTPIVMAFLFYSTFAPIGLFFKAFGKDLLNQQIDKNAKTYWIERKHPIGSMTKQF
jgi:hypothetical protein|tara:strand:- start:4007 stop:4411 length:405 start_codon:yes stop_codon:yes gene_type:complete